MDRYEKLWAVVLAARQASADLQKQKLKPSDPITREKREEWSVTHGRAFFAALLDFFGEQETFIPDIRYFEAGGKIDTRNLSSLRAAPDQQVAIRLAADMIDIDQAPINSQLIPEMDAFSETFAGAIVLPPRDRPRTKRFIRDGFKRDE